QRPLGVRVARGRARLEHEDICGGAQDPDGDDGERREDQPLAAQRAEAALACGAAPAGAGAVTVAVLVRVAAVVIAVESVTVVVVGVAARLRGLRLGRRPFVAAVGGGGVVVRPGVVARPAVVARPGVVVGPGVAARGGEPVASRRGLEAAARAAPPAAVRIVLAVVRESRAVVVPFLLPGVGHALRASAAKGLRPRSRLAGPGREAAHRVAHRLARAGAVLVED